VNEIEVGRPNWKQSNTMTSREMRQKSRFRMGTMKNDAMDKGIGGMGAGF
jgi:hypothetical protein